MISGIDIEDMKDDGSQKDLVDYVYYNTSIMYSEAKQLVEDLLKVYNITPKE